MRSKVGLLVVALLLVSRASGRAAEAPVAVSPGDTSKLVWIESRCPTFSWGEVDSASHYELLVYRLGEDGDEAQPVLRQTFAGSVDGWTPALDQCLVRGGRYAWSVRAVGRKEASEWSRPSLFEVAPEPTEAEFRRALEVVDRYLDDTEAEGSTGEVREKTAMGSPAVEGELRSGEALSPGTAAYVPETGDLTIRGTVVADRLRYPCSGSGGSPSTGRWSVNEHCYYASKWDTPLTWAEAQAICQVQMGAKPAGGYLVTLTSSAEETFVRALFVPGSFADVLEHVWIGYSDARTEGAWDWITGEVGVTGNDSTYVGWELGEPNDQGGEDCAELIPGGWNDKDCATEFLQFVCETDH